MIYFYHFVWLTFKILYRLTSRCIQSDLRGRKFFFQLSDNWFGNNYITHTNRPLNSNRSYVFRLINNTVDAVRIFLVIKRTHHSWETTDNFYTIVGFLHLFFNFGVIWDTNLFEYLFFVCWLVNILIW